MLPQTSEAAARRGRHARRHALAHGHTDVPAVDFEALKQARRRRVPAAELEALLSDAAAACRADPCGRYQHLFYVLSLLRAESRLVEMGAASPGGRSAAVDLASSGATALALWALSEHCCCDGADRARLAAAGAATLGHLVAMGGDSKRALLEAGGVATLVACLAHLGRTSGSVAETELLLPCHSSCRSARHRIAQASPNPRPRRSRGRSCCSWRTLSAVALPWS